MRSLPRIVRRQVRGARRLWRRIGPGGTAILERNHDYRRTLLLVGSARSGSTWLSDVLEESLRCRVIFEPLRRDKVPVAHALPWGFFADPNVRDPALYGVIDCIMSGRLRSMWTDDGNRHRFPRHRLVKEIRATNLLPWIVRNFPDLPVIYLVRHPIPSALSAAQLEWDPFLEEFVRQEPLMTGPLGPFAATIAGYAEGDLFHRHVLRWCMENAIPVRFLAPGSVHVAFYEDLVEDPGRELARLAGFLRRFTAGRWVLTEDLPPAVDRSSRTNYRETPLSAPSDRLASWLAELPEETVNSALTVVRAFGLDRVYGGGTRPLVTPDALLLGDVDAAAAESSAAESSAAESSAAGPSGETGAGRRS